METNKVYQKLLELSFEAAHIFPNNINDAINYIANKQLVDDNDMAQKHKDNHYHGM